MLKKKFLEYLFHLPLFSLCYASFSSIWSVSFTLLSWAQLTSVCLTCIRPWWMSLVISTMITVSDIVRRVTPPKKETEPRRANAPGSIHAQYLCVCGASVVIFDICTGWHNLMCHPVSCFKVVWYIRGNRLLEKSASVMTGILSEKRCTDEMASFLLHQLLLRLTCPEEPPSYIIQQLLVQLFLFHYCLLTLGQSPGCFAWEGLTEHLGPDSDGKIWSFEKSFKSPYINQEWICSTGKVKGLSKGPFKGPKFSNRIGPLTHWLLPHFAPGK